jgi:hypothetical protein
LNENKLIPKEICNNNRIVIKMMELKKNNIKPYFIKQEKEGKIEIFFENIPRESKIL